VAIAAATRPIAILRIMMLTSIRSEHPSLPNQTQRFSLSCSVRHCRPVSRLQNPSLWWAEVAALRAVLVGAAPGASQGGADADA
jgi:hypothetical protein